MKNRNDIIIILESIRDDYYFLWECFSEYSQIKKYKTSAVDIFSQSLKEAFDLKYIDFYEGVNFDGDEILLSSFILNNLVIEKLLQWENDSKPEIRVMTSKKGIEFLESL